MSKLILPRRKFLAGLAAALAAPAIVRAENIMPVRALVQPPRFTLELDGTNDISIYQFVGRGWAFSDTEAAQLHNYFISRFGDDVKVSRATGDGVEAMFAWDRRRSLGQ